MSILKQYRWHRELAWRAAVGVAVFGISWKTASLVPHVMAELVQAVSLFCFAWTLYRTFDQGRLANQKLDELLDQIKDLKETQGEEAAR
jgi:hypothetical protein